MLPASRTSQSLSAGWWWSWSAKRSPARRRTAARSKWRASAQACCAVCAASAAGSTSSGAARVTVVRRSPVAGSVTGWWGPLRGWVVPVAVAESGQVMTPSCVAVRSAYPLGGVGNTRRTPDRVQSCAVAPLRRHGWARAATRRRRATGHPQPTTTDAPAAGNRAARGGTGGRGRQPADAGLRDTHSRPRRTRQPHAIEPLGAAQVGAGGSPPTPGYGTPTADHDGRGLSSYRPRAAWAP